METQNTSVARRNDYSDLDFKFKLNPNTKDFVLKKGVEAVKQSVVNILLTAPGERPFNPYFGGNLYQYLFENFDDVTTAAIKSTVINSLRNFEPRVRVIDVQVDNLDYRNALRITVEFRIITPEVQEASVEFVVERLR